MSTSTKYGNFDEFCRDATLPICNLISDTHDQVGSWGGCELKGIPLGDDRHLANVGSIILCGLAIAISVYLFLESEKKKAAVGRREIQLFLIGYGIISICEIFSVGGFPLNATVRVVFSAIHIGMIVATTWILMLNAVVGYQLLDDGTSLSVTLFLTSAAAFFIGTGYIALDTGLSWTGFWDSTYVLPNRSYALYTLYQLLPLIFIVAFFVLESVLVIRVLGERRPMEWLLAAAVLFAIGQVFSYVAGPHICKGTSGKIDGALFETLFTLLAVISVWSFWSSITEDDWPMPAADTYSDPSHSYN